MLDKVKAFFVDNIADPAESNTEHALQIATAVLLIEISRADAKVAVAEEAAIIEAVKAVFNLDENETAKIVSLAENEVDHAVSLFDFTRLINARFSPAQKVHLVELLWQVAYSDTRIDHYEDYYIRKISDLLYVSHSDFIRTKLRVLETAKPAGD